MKIVSQTADQPGMIGALERFGFHPAGAWISYDRVSSGIGCPLVAFADARVVYAFVVDDRAMYIGICDKDTTTLKKRMGRYQGRQGSGTNERVAGLIPECLAGGKSVAIWALRPKDGVVDYKGHRRSCEGARKSFHPRTEAAVEQGRAFLCGGR
jgi:hypothetical protein